MQYEFVKEKDVAVLRRQRLRSLELDHCAALIALEENPSDVLTQQDIVELERRIAHHRTVLSPASEEVGKEVQPAEDNPS